MMASRAVWATEDKGLRREVWGRRGGGGGKGLTGLVVLL